MYSGVLGLGTKHLYDIASKTPQVRIRYQNGLCGTGLQVDMT